MGFPLNPHWVLLPSSRALGSCWWLSSQTCLLCLATRIKSFCLRSGCSSLPSHFGSVHCPHISLLPLTLSLCASGPSHAALAKLVLLLFHVWSQLWELQVRALFLSCAQERQLHITDHLNFCWATTTESLWLCYSWQSFHCCKSTERWEMDTDGLGQACPVNLVLPLPHWETLGKLLNLFQPQFLICKMVIIIVSC